MINTKIPLSEISNVLKRGNKIVIYPHVNVDADGVGSAVGLCLALRQLGKTSYVFIDEKIPENLEFLTQDCVTDQADVVCNADINVCVDCSDIKRLGARKDAFKTAGTSVCIDHHATEVPFCDFNHIDKHAAATGELIFALINHMGIEEDATIGSSLYAAICSDTGNFRYSNTTKLTHEIVSGLFDWGISPDEISILLFESNRIERLMLESLAISGVVMFCGGRLAMTCVTQEMLEQTGAYMDEADQIVSILRGIQGVEIAALLKEEIDGRVKVSLRSKNFVDVSKIAQSMGGGGHKRAAGVAMRASIEEAFEKMSKILVDAIDKSE